MEKEDKTKPICFAIEKKRWMLKHATDRKDWTNGDLKADMTV